MKKTITDRVKEVAKKGQKQINEKQYKQYEGNLKEGEKKGYQLRSVSDPQVVVYGLIKSN